MHPHSHDKSVPPPIAVLTVRIAEDGFLQQILNLDGDKFVVGESPQAVSWMLRKESDGVAPFAPFAKRITQALESWPHPLELRCSADLALWPWATWLAHLGVSDFSLRTDRTKVNIPENGELNVGNSRAPGSAVNELPSRGYRHVTSLSYDLAGSTDLMARLGAETYSQLLAQLHTRFASLVMAGGGQADLPQGDDGCMCYFGLGVANDRADLLALHAALAMAQSAEQNGWTVRIGIASGWVSVDMDQPVGMSIHLAARLQKLAPTGQVYVTGALADNCEAWFQFSRLPSMDDIKGFPPGQRMAQLVAASAAPAQAQQASAGQVAIGAHFVGRQTDVLALDAALQRAATFRSTDILLLGEAGIGKSSLLRHWLSRQVRHELITLRCGPHDQRKPFAALTQWLANRMGYLAEGSASQRLAHFESLLKSQASWQAHEAAWRHLFELPPLDGPKGYEDPGAAHAAAMGALVAEVMALARQSVVIVAVEDYHWVDASTAAALSALRDAAAHSSGLLLIVTQRPALPAQPSYEAQYQTLALAPLTPAQSQKLVAQISPAMGADQPFLHALYSRAQGIPLFLHECARLYDLPAFQTELNTARKLGIGLPVPANLQSLTMSRLDRLGPVRQLAQVAAVLGEGLTWPVMEAVAEELNLSNALGVTLAQARSELEIAGVWRPASGNRTGLAAQVVFTHALLRDAAYQSLWETDRKRLHDLCAKVLSRLDTEGTHHHAAELARHLAVAGKVEEAVAQLMRAGKSCKRRGAHQIARQTMQTALDLLTLAPQGQKIDFTRAEAHLALAGQIFITDGHGTSEVLDQYGHALQLGRNLQDSDLILRALLGTQLIHFMNGNFALARRELEEADAVAQQVRRALTTLQCDWALANLEFYEGDLVSSAQRMQSCIEQCQTHALGSGLIQNPLVMAQLYRAFALACLGQTDAADKLARTGCMLADEGDNRLAKVQAHGIAAMVAYAAGEWAAALQHAQQATASCAPSEYALWLAHAQFMEGAARARLGQLEQGLGSMQSGHTQWARHGGVLTRSYYGAIEAEILLDAGRLPEANISITQAQHAMNVIREGYYASEVMRIQACIALAQATSDSQRDNAARVLEMALHDAHRRELHGLALRCAISLHERAYEANMSGSPHHSLADALAAALPGGRNADTNRAQALLATRPCAKVVSLHRFDRR